MTRPFNTACSFLKLFGKATMHLPMLNSPNLFPNVYILTNLNSSQIFMQNDLHSIRTAVAGRYTCYRGSRLMQTISVLISLGISQDHWLEVAILRWLANSGGR